MYNVKMDCKSALNWIDNLIFNRTGKYLSDLEREIFIGSWEGKTYEKIYPVNPQYLEKDVGYKLWKKLSDVFGEKVTKKNIRGALERAWTHQLWRSQPDTSPKRLFIFHQEQEPDLSIAAQLSQGLRQAGHQAHLSRDGIDQPLKQCDGFLLLISPNSAGSEMILELLRRAKELQESRPNRKPILIPIRVNCPPHFPLNHDLREYINGCETYEWTSEKDLPQIVHNAVNSLSKNFSMVASQESLSPSPQWPPFDSPPLPVAEPELPSGQVKLASAFYVERSPCESLCYREIANPGALIRIKAPRQMGKTSLMARILSHAAELGYRTVPLSFQHADTAVFTSLERLLQWFCAKIARKLRLNDRIDDRWSDYFGSKDNCTAYFEDCLLSKASAPLVLGLDEVDRVFQYPTLADDFFGLLRAWYEEAGYGDSNSELWQTLRLVVVHSTEVYIPLNVNQSPFNVGLPIELPEFSPGQVQDLARRHGLSWETPQVHRLMGFVGGHPYLVRLALYYMAQQQVTLAQLLATGATEAGLYGDHLRRHLWSLQQHPELAVAFGRVVGSHEGVELESAIAFKLHSMGLVHLQGNHVIPRFELYRQYFRDRVPLP